MKQTAIPWSVRNGGTGMIAPVRCLAWVLGPHDWFADLAGNEFFWEISFILMMTAVGNSPKVTEVR